MATKKTKISIKPFRQQAMDPSYAQKTWKLLKGAIQEIHKKNASGLSFEELYRNAYNMVLHKYGDVLYNGLKEVVDEHLRDIAEQVSNAGDANFLSELEKVWLDHKLSMIMIRDILMYMDRVYVQNNLSPVYDLGLYLFRDNVARSPKIKERLWRTLDKMIHDERTGEVINRSLIKSITQMLIDLGVNSRIVYEEDFEKMFLKASTNFYKSESQSFIASSCSDYMKKAETRIKEELERVSHYLDKSSEPKIREVVEHELLSVHLKTLIEKDSGEIAMLRDNKIEDLKRMFILFGRIPEGHPTMRDYLNSYIREIGRALITDEEKQKDHLVLVQNLLDLKEKFDNILQGAFNNDKNFHQTLNQAFEYVINLSQKSPEFISLFIDEKLKKGLKGVSEDEVDIVLDKVMTLFRFLQEKDVFEKYYKQHLARRLLLGRSVSDDSEKNMIGKLKTECGYQFTSKLEGMFLDMKLSNDTMEGFKKYLRSGEKSLGNIDMNVYVLTTGFWPTQSAATCILPTEIQLCCDIFKQYYLSNHNGRKLSWQTNMGTTDLKATFGTKKHEVTVSTYQMVILLLFNQKPEWSYKEIHEATQIPIADLKRNLFSLSCGKYVLLNKKPEAKKIDDMDVFAFNSKFKSKLFKVKVMSVVQKETEPEAQETRQKVDEDRKHQIEAALVRIMKARKTLEHSILIAECTKQLQSRFMPTPQVIKKRIESLIERDYLERSKGDRKVYNYLA